jgi:NPCBM/NEW2 domain
MGLPLILAAVLAAAGTEVQIGTLDGATVSGSFVSIGADAVVVETPTGEVKISSDRLLSLAPKGTQERATSDSTAWIDLTDGSRVEGRNFQLADSIALFSVGEEKYSLPADAIRVIHFSRPGDPASQAWPANIGAEPKEDLLVVRKKSAVDFLEGTISAIDENHLFFKTEGESIAVPLAKIDGLVIFHKGGDKPPDPTCIIEDSHGWRLKAKKLVSAGQRLQVSTIAGPTFELPIDDITRIDFSAGKVIYLSDLDPDKQQWTPYVDFGKEAQSLAEFYELRRDEGRNHELIAVRGKTFAKGISLTSRTALEYRLPGGIKRFKALAAIDDSVREIGNVKLQIAADGKKLLDREIAGSDDPVDIDLDVTGARRLSILVDYGKGMDAGDYLNLADARVVK